MDKACIVALVACTAAGQTVLWDESVDGDLGGLNTDGSPTFVGILNVGANLVSGTTAPIAAGDLNDAFSYTVAAGTTLESVILTFYTPATGGTSGIVYYDTLGGDSTGSFLGGASYGGADVGSDTLFGSLGLDSLGAGDYTTSVREFGGPDASWTLEFNVVPTPGAATVLGLGGIAAMRRRR
ncbi:MAG: hypothetical protein AAGI53_06540 [Planctomycetota bacterium]